MKTFAVTLGLLLLACNLGIAIWAIGEINKQGCELGNLRRLEVTDAGKGTAATSRVNLDGSQVFTLHAQFPGAQTCERRPF